MNQDISKLVERYEADRNYYLTDRYNETLRRSDFDLSSYICTDPDCLQFVKKETECCWHYIQVIDDSILSSFNGDSTAFVAAYDNKSIINSVDIRKAINGDSIVAASVDLNDYSEDEIESYINGFGYSLRNGSKLTNIKEECGDEWKQLCSEFIFEQLISEMLTNEQIKLMRI